MFLRFPTVGNFLGSGGLSSYSSCTFVETLLDKDTSYIFSFELQPQDLDPSTPNPTPLDAPSRPLWYKLIPSWPGLAIVLHYPGPLSNLGLIRYTNCPESVPNCPMSLRIRLGPSYNIPFDRTAPKRSSMGRFL